MPFVAADGSNYETANSFVSLEYADDYFTLRGNALWDGDDDKLQAALIKATDYIEQAYGPRWIGCLDRSYGLSWPRYNTSYESDAIPDALKKAVCELALEALTGELNPVITADPTVKREKVDVIEVEYDTTKPRYAMRPAVVGYLKPLLRGSAFNVPVVRV